MSFPTEGLSIDLLERVLTKLGLSDRPAPTLDGLQALYAAWCRKVPFDPQDIRSTSAAHHNVTGDSQIRAGPWAKPRISPFARS